MKNLIKIIATMTMLGTMTACGASGALDDLANAIGEGLNSLQNLRLQAAARQIRTEELAEFRENLDSSLTDQQREDMVVAEATRLANLTGTEKAEFDAKVQTRVNYLAEVAGLTIAEREANELQCQQETTGAGCDVVLATFCDARPFDNFCFSDPAYDDRRVEICEVDSVRNNCEDTIFRVCAANPFITLCVGDDRYDRVRAVRCAVNDTEKASPRCAATVKRVCDLDVEDSLCDLIPAYTSQRLTIEDTVQEIISRDCANRPGDGRCETIIRFVCERQPLNPACDNRSAYRPARVTECLTGDRRNSDQLCARTVEQVCSANSLEDLCVGVDAYASLQAAACRGESATSKPECAATLTLVCGNLAGTSATGDPFGPVCSNAVFQPARSAISLACVGDASGRLCVSERNRICGNTPFNPVCKRSEYLYLQIRACIGKTAEGNCVDDTFFTDPVILSCLTDPFNVACTASDSAFKPYETDALDATCLLAVSGTRAGCANPTAVFATLPTSLLAIRQKPAEPHHISTNPYRNGFITIDPSHIGDDGNLVVSFGESGNFEVATTRADGSDLDHTAPSLKVNAGGAIVDDPKTTDINEANPFIPGGAVTLRRDSGATDNSDSDDGVAYFATTDAGGNSNGLAYGGILPTTNLGAPLLPQPVGLNEDNITAIWEGHVSYRQNPNVQNRVTNFYVDFTAGTIGFANTAETDGTGVVDAPIAVGGTNLRLSGKFGDSHNGLDGLPLAPGELGGTVGFYFGVFSATNTKPNAGEFNLHGLIGQEGVVGVFLNTTTGGTLVGGFTASNPDHPNNK